MSSINIRDAKDDPIDEIIFADDQFLKGLQSRGGFSIVDDNDGELLQVAWADVPYLIKALEKALEVAETAEVVRRNTTNRPDISGRYVNN